MQHNLKATGLTLTPEIRSYIAAKLQALDKLLDDAASARADVELQYLQTEDKTYRAECMLYDRLVLRAEARGRGLHEAIDKSVEELFVELSRAKKKKRHLFRRGASRVKDFLRGWRSRP